VLLGASTTFTALVLNSSNTAVTWSVNGIAGGSAQTGWITAGGVYTAPGDLPVERSVQITATSVADSAKSATATVTISSDIAVSLSASPSSIELGGVQAFHAAIQSSGKPDAAIRWSLSGPACPASCGTIDSNGNYTAPPILPGAPVVSVVATSAADPSKQATANANIAADFSLSISAPQTVQQSSVASLSVTFNLPANSNPSEAVAWSLSGNGCGSSAGACGTLSVVTAQNAAVGGTASIATYIAPSLPPRPDSVTIVVTPRADPARQIQTNIVILGANGEVLGITPASATLAIKERLTFEANASGTGTQGFSWAVNNVPGGNASVGMICAVFSNPCQQVSVSNSSAVDYVAPGAIPSPNPLTISVTSPGTALTANAQIAVIPHVLVSVSPASVTLSPYATQAFSAQVLGSMNQSVVWQVQGSACSVSLACGTIDGNGIYTAPASAPSPDSMQIVAISQDDPSQSGSASVVISNQLAIQTVQPSSVYAGAAAGFLLRVIGNGFIPSTSGTGSTVIVAGTPRFTTCTAVNSCSAEVTAADVADAGNVSVQVQNPDQTSSNAVSLIVAPLGSGEDVIALTPSAPTVTGKDITVVDLTTAGIDTASQNLDLAFAAAGAFNTATNTCTLAGNPIRITRPASGSSAADICVFSSAGLDPTMTYSVSGSGDVTVLSAQPAPFGIVHLTLQISSAASAGPRTLFVQNVNLDRSAASGLLNIY
jgi:hypothetical protein